MSSPGAAVRLACAAVRALLPRDLAGPVLADLERELAQRGGGDQRRGGEIAGAFWLLREGVRLALRLRFARGVDAAQAPRTLPFAEVLGSDVRLALRRLIAAPGVSVVAIVTLALGIGASTAFFSVLHAVLLRPLPYADPDRVVRVQGGWSGGYGDWLSQPEILDLRSRVSGLASVGGFSDGAANLTDGGEPERVIAAAATPDLFTMLGVSAALGRTFTPEEGLLGATPAVVLSDGLFQRRFGADPSVIGRSIEVTGALRTVVGVLPPDFRLPTDFRGQPTELFLPLVIDPDSLEGRGSHYIHTFARLAPDVGVERASSELQALGAALTGEGLYQAANPFAFRAVALRENVLGPVRTAMLVLIGAVGFVLLIACANVANLLLARGEERQKEMSVRVAMGADRRRLGRQVLTESLVLGAIGGAAGVAVALGGTRLLVALDPGSIPRLQQVAVDGRALGFTAAVALLTGALFGVLPALQAGRTDVQLGLREGGRSGTAGTARQRARRLLVVAEIALAVVLVVGAGLMARTLGALHAIDTGFDPRGVLTLRVALPGSDYPTQNDVTAIVERLRREAADVSGVRAAGAVRIVPLTQTIGDWSIDIEGKEKAPGENPHGDWQSVAPGYFEAMGMRLVAGRLIESTDVAGVPLVAVVNRTMADTYWPDGAVGQRFRTGSKRPWATIVGVVGDVRRNRLAEAPRTEMYHPHAQYAEAYGFAPREMSLVVKTDGDPRALIAPMRELVRRLDPNLPVADVRTMDDVLAASVAEQRFMATLLTAFGAVALLMAAVGIYGVLAYSVSRRTQEIGIRMALGAGRSRVLRLVLGEGLQLTAAGVVGGIALAAVLTRAMSSLVYGVKTLDPLTFALVPLVLAACALVATGLPALRASGVEPSRVLRDG